MLNRRDQFLWGREGLCPHRDCVPFGTLLCTPGLDADLDYTEIVPLFVVYRS